MEGTCILLWSCLYYFISHSSRDVGAHSNCGKRREDVQCNRLESRLDNRPTTPHSRPATSASKLYLHRAYSAAGRKAIFIDLDLLRCIIFFTAVGGSSSRIRNGNSTTKPTRLLLQNVGRGASTETWQTCEDVAKRRNDSNHATGIVLHAGWLLEAERSK